MTFPTSITALADAAIAYLALHTPWMADKVAGAVMAQPVREVWVWVKEKLQTSSTGRTAIERVASGLDSGEAAETLKQPLLEALQSDPGFAERLASLIRPDSGAQTIVGDHNKAVKVSNSSDINISVG